MSNILKSESASHSSAANPSQFPCAGPDFAGWLAASAGAGAAERKSFRLRLAVLEHQLARGLDLNERGDFSCLQRRQLEPSDDVIAHALAFLREMGPRALFCDEDGDAVRQAMAVAGCELIERGQTDALLVLCPAEETAAWRERLTDGFGLPARVCGEDEVAHLPEGGCWIADFATAARRAQQFADRGFGAILLDEAHATSAEEARLLRRVLAAENAFVFARTSSPLHDGFATLHRALDLVRGQNPHPLGPWDEFAQVFLQGDTTARFVRRGAEDEFRARLAPWLRRRSGAAAGASEPAAKRTRRVVKDHPVEAQQREKEFLDLAYRAALAFPEGAREHYLAAALGGPWHFADAVEKALSRNLVTEAGMKRMLQDLVVRGRSVRETAKAAELATLAKKALKDRDARLLVCVRNGATAVGVAQAIGQAGLMEQVEALREGNDGLNRLAIQRFVLGEKRVLIAPDAAAHGQVIRGVTELIHYDLPIEPTDHVGRLEHLGVAGAKCAIRRIVLKGGPEDAAVHGAMARLGFHELEPDEVSGWLADLGFAGGAAGWTRFLLNRAADAFGGHLREEELLPLLERRKTAESSRLERRRAAERALGELTRAGAGRRAAIEGDAPRFSVPQLIAASLELRQGGWQVTDDKRILLDEGGQKYELRTPETPGRTLEQAPAAGERAQVCEPGSWAWRRLTSRFRGGSRWFLADARDYPLDRVARKIEEQLTPHGLVLESLRVAATEVTAACSLHLRGRAACGPERHEALFEVSSTVEGHKLEAYLDAPETLPAPDGSRLPVVKELDEAARAALTAAHQRAEDSVRDAAFQRADLTSFLRQANARGGNPQRPTPAAQLTLEPVGAVGVLYAVVTVEARVRHRDQTAAWPIQLRCVPVSGLLLEDLPRPAGADAAAPLWACGGGHLVPAGSIRTCATPGCSNGMCPEHAGASAGLRACTECGKERCSKHALDCSQCGRALCAEHLQKVESGSLACTQCVVTLDDGRRFLRDEILQSAVSRRSGPKTEMMRSPISGRWAFASEFVACAASGRRVLPDEIGQCAKSGKRVARDLLVEDPVSGATCLDEYFVASAVSGVRALPENLVRSEASGRLALPSEIKACGTCGARLLPDEVTTCPETGAHGCAAHLRRCAETGVMVLPEALARCEVSGAEVRRSLLRTCPETGKRARAQYFVACAASGDLVLPEGLEACAVTGRRVRRSLLQNCAATGRRVLPEHLGTCSITGRRVVLDLLTQCPETGAWLLKEKTVSCEETGAPCAPEALETCAATRRRVRRSLLGVDDVSGQRVLLRLLRKCPRTGRNTLAERFGACSVSGAQVIATELAQCQETGRPALPDKLERCAASGAMVHPDQLVACAATRRRVLRRLAETCEVSGELVAPGVLEACSITGKRVMPSLLGINELTGSKVLKELLVSCERTGKKTLRENLVRSAVSGAEISEDIVVHCAVTNAPALPEELATCAATGKRVLPSLLGTCQVSGNKILDEYLATCEASGKRVRPDLLQTCSRSGRRMLPQHLGTSKLSGDRGAKELLVLCEASRRQVFPDELVLSELSGKRIGKDRAVHCGVSGLLVDVGETTPCALCRQPVATNEVLDGLCCACMDLVGRRQGVDAGLATVGALQRDCKWAGRVQATVHGDTVRVLARRRFLGALRDPWLVVLRRPGPRGPGAPAPTPATVGEGAGQLEIVLQERISRDTRKELKRRLREMARAAKQAGKEKAKATPAA